MTPKMDLLFPLHAHHRVCSGISHRKGPYICRRASENPVHIAGRRLGPGDTMLLGPGGSLKVYHVQGGAHPGAGAVDRQVHQPAPTTHGLHPALTDAVLQFPKSLQVLTGPSQPCPLWSSVPVGRQDQLGAAFLPGRVPPGRETCGASCPDGRDRCERGQVLKQTQ
ncbi:corrinoid adenosyltransferase MMAB isoform X1 [Homo sapiens]|uniref:corrinoid adenosyltransferase MMAB isoform X1 n=1 Tax=Homo sapiens TaxID=9606 RepID=UPI0005D02CD6|nr:corrinoid adenosyltransferase MMAB isoform X1 [Homo sapiens]XP_054227898.1 corrinoid adenosyltransferase MMAB isoform X1 [Homo sapiens]|eukprot:XP_011536569.1 cob(I)yrinic acid a,c-diamide adenosyltransferase, mitochondrial isoform X2 [Homo sapiens]